MESALPGTAAASPGEIVSTSGLPNGVLAPPLLFAGPVLIGCLFAYLLFGVLLAQVVQYYQAVTRSEHKIVKMLVGLVVVIQVTQLGLISDTAWTTCVLGFVDPINMIRPPPSAPGTGILNGAVALVVQSFFAWRIYTLGAKTPLAIGAAVLVFLTTLLQMGAAIGVAVMFMASGRSSQELFKLKTPITLGLTSTVACDLLITAAMIVILATYKGKTSFTRTKSILNTLIIATVENGMITTIGAIANLIVFFLRTQDMINIAVTYVVGGLYAIVFITTLNRRVVGASRTDGTSISLSDADGFTNSRVHQGNTVATSRGPAPSYQVNVLSSMSAVETKTEGIDPDIGLLEANRPRGDIMVSVSKEVHTYGEIDYNNPN